MPLDFQHFFHDHCVCTESSSTAKCNQMIKEMEASDTKTAQASKEQGAKQPAGELPAEMPAGAARTNRRSFEERPPPPPLVLGLKPTQRAICIFPSNGQPQATGDRGTGPTSERLGTMSKPRKVLKACVANQFDTERTKEADRAQHGRAGRTAGEQQRALQKDLGGWR